MSFIRVLAFAAALCCLWAACFGQPSSIEPILPPIPDPPYEHTVRFCGIANNENFNLNSTDVSSKCDWKRYAISFVAFVAAPIALGCAAIIISIILPFILCFKCCAHGPVSGMVRLILVIAFGALLTAGFVLIYVGNGKTTNTVNDLSTTISTTLDTAQLRLTTAKDLAAQLPYSNSSQELQVFDEVAGTLSTFQTETKTITDKVKQYDTYRKAALFVGSLVPLAMIIGAGLIGLFNIFKPLMGILAWLLVFLSVVVWICMIVHLVIGKALSDICWEVDLAEAQGNSGALAILVKCRTNETPLQDVRNLINSAINNATEQACDTTSQTCFVPNGGPVNCTLPSWSCTEASLPEWLEFNMTDVAIECTDGSSTVYADPNDGCPSGFSFVSVAQQQLIVKDCPTTCRNPRFRDAANQGIDGINTLLKYYQLRDDLLPLLTCDFVAEAFFNAKSSVCKTFSNALTLIFAGATLEAVGMGLAMAALVHIFLGHYGRKNISNPRDTL